MAYIINLYRLDLITDTSATADRIDFNASSTKATDVENAYITNIDRPASDGVGDNQGAEQPLGDLQALGTVEDMIVLQGFISKRDGNSDDGNNAFVQKLRTWNDGTKVSANWPEGRFGIVDNGDSDNTITPVRTGSNQLGLIWESYDKRSDLAHNRVNFTIRLRISKGDGT